jgi:hypothetical protein
MLQAQNQLLNEFFDMNKVINKHTANEPQKLPHGNRLAYVLAVAFAMVSLPGMATDRSQSDDPDAKEKVVAEIDWQLPTPPANNDLLPFYVSKTTRQAFALDTKSLSVDTDGVIRYTIVGTSSAGAKNISYEGIRCSGFEKRIYALGHADGTWARARDSEWQPIPIKGPNLQHAELAQNYFCNNGQIVGKAPQILQSMRYRKGGLVQPY